MKKGLLILLVLITAGTGGYYAWDRYYAPERIDTWSLVPETALTVYETQRLGLVWSEVQSNPLYRDMLALPYVAGIKEQFSLLDSLSGETGSIDKLTSGRRVLISSHLTDPNHLGHLFIVPVDESAVRNMLSTVREKLSSRKDIKLETRNYKTFKIRDIRNTSSGEQFSYVIHAGHFLGSYNSLLVEDAIRNLETRTTGSFQKEHPQLLQVARMRQDAGNLYVDFSRLGQLFSAFAKDKKSDWLKGLNQLGHGSFMDVNLHDKGLLLNGFTFADDRRNEDYLGTFYDLGPLPMTMGDLIPEQTAAFYHYSFDNPLKWEEQLKAFWTTTAPKQLARREQMEQRSKTEFSGLFDWFGGEIGLAVQESKYDAVDKLLLIKARDAGQALNSLNKLASNSTMLSGDTLYQETYSDTYITQIYLKEFPSALLGAPFDGFEQCFFAAVGGYVVMGNSVQVIKNLLDDREAEATWGRSIRYKAFLDEHLTESNLSMVIDTRRAWQMMLRSMAPEWEAFMQKHQQPLRNFSLIGMQFSYLDAKFYTSMALSYELSKKQQVQVSSQFDVQQRLILDTGIYSQPFVVRNHSNNALEVFLQDSAWNVHLIGDNGKVLWTDSIGEPIEGEVFQIDLYKNNKLQYLFATASALHCLDRTGKSVAGYPVAINSHHPAGLNVIDYDNSKNYRFVLYDNEGSIYLYDAAGNNLEGWNPKRLGASLSAAPYHVRIRNRDCFVTSLQNGLIYLLNRRGEPLPGFPIDLKERLFNPIFTEEGSSFESTVLHTVTENGEVVRFNMEGTILNREQLYRPSSDTRFLLNINSRNRNYYIARQEPSRLTMLDRAGEVVFEKDYIISGADALVQSYDFSAGQALFPVTDPVQGYTYLYNQEGRLINFQPINSVSRVGVLRYESTGFTHVYHVYNRQLQISRFQH